MKKKFTFESKVVLWPGVQGAWHFAHVPKDMSQHLRNDCKHFMRGWSSFRVHAQIGKTAWDTSIFYDKKSGTFILPLKASIRKEEDIMAGDRINVMVRMIDQEVKK